MVGDVVDQLRGGSTRFMSRLRLDADQHGCRTGLLAGQGSGEFEAVHGHNAIIRIRRRDQCWRIVCPTGRRLWYGEYFRIDVNCSASSIFPYSSTQTHLAVKR